MMKESQRVKSLFAKQYDGDCWLGVNFQEKLTQININQATYKFSTKTNSIWEILNHLISWREVVLASLPKNTYSSPEDNYFQAIIDPSEAEWLKTLNRFRNSQQGWLEYLSNLDDSIFEKQVVNKNYNYYELIHGILHHDIYHLGQISLLVRLTTEVS
ncbi:DinB family protein [uncultured Algoriphagus sp.]|uniref:DinB family protein n=1 Tax=uncultured Algoriphagus sp. TaxID=417365 RepID=UPI0030ECC611|tara:strand:+ start:7638 stop:8111 length:474 start_codon:yes stop_codon:yes gene_type:complete